MELLDIVDENNNLTGEIIDREIAHEKGLWHREVGVIIVNEEGKMLLEKRSPTKKQSPNKWGLCAGHIEAGDIHDNAIVREMQEEIGVQISIDELEFITIIKRNLKFNEKQYNKAFQYIYLWKTNKKESDFIVQKEELTKVKYFEIEEIKNKMKQNSSDLAFSSEKCIEETISIIEEKIKK